MLLYRIRARYAETSFKLIVVNNSDLLVTDFKEMNEVAQIEDGDWPHDLRGRRTWPSPPWRRERWPRSAWSQWTRPWPAGSALAAEAGMEVPETGLEAASKSPNLSKELFLKTAKPAKQDMAVPYPIPMLLAAMVMEYKFIWSNEALLIR